MTGAWLAQAETRSYVFAGIGSTKEEAIAAVRRGWNRWARLTGATLRWGEIRDDVNTLYMEAGEGYIDFDRKVGKHAR